MKFRLCLSSLLTFCVISVFGQSTFEWKNGKSGGYNYRYVSKDPTKSRFYTLKNGLTVILSQNNQEPNITFKMAVRAGSNTDPKNNTGLAHYLEHLMFKGTDKFGTIDFTKEKPILDQIESLYEEYIKTTDSSTRKKIYEQIDKKSGEASKYSIANEYDKLMKSIGSRGTNAHTSVEETVYEEDLPSNAVDKFIAIQAERFRSPVFRLFHTELETVYEEKNRGLDNDDRKSYESLLKALFPTHNYGQQTTIGTIEHLKNPSLVEIRNYYNKYYVPNNMAFIMSGDINYDEIISKIDKNFAFMKPKAFEEYNPAPEAKLNNIVNLDVYGPSPENLTIGYRGYAQNSKESLLLDLISNILSNQKAGLIDVNILKQQKLLYAGAGYEQMKDYGMFMLYGAPREGQSLLEVQKILMEQIAMLKQGKFDASLIAATVANRKFNELQAYDKNGVRAEAAMISFIQNRGKQWDKTLQATDMMSKITKKELVDFANQFFADNYVVINKRQGEDKSIIKVDKPLITAVETNPNEISTYAKLMIDKKVPPIAPRFVDFRKDLSFSKAKIADVLYVQNKENEIFRMSYRFEKGSLNYKLLPHAVEYLEFLGTDKISSEQLSKEFYDIACSYNVNVGNEVTTLTITGLQENFQRAVTLVENLLKNCKPNEAALVELKKSILKSRENAKLSKESILSGLSSYAQYGSDNPFNYGATNAEINSMTSTSLISLLHNLTNYKHDIIYYGPQELAVLSNEINKIHPLPVEFTPESPMKKFVYKSTDSNRVYFCNYDMVQAEIRWIRNAGVYNPNEAALASLFNNYFGSGMGSVVVQTIRESKALAYSAYAYYSTPTSLEKQAGIVAYVGTQADKMNEAITGMDLLIKDLPESEKTFTLSKDNLLNSIETERITKDQIIYYYLASRKLGFDHDPRIDKYSAAKPLSFSDLKNFHQQNLSGKPFNYCVVGSEKNISIQDLAKLGIIKKLDLKTIFGY